MDSDSKFLPAIIVLLSLSFGVLVGLIDSFVDAFIFKKNTLFEQIFHPTTFEIYIRSLILMIFLVFSYIVVHIITKLSKSESEKQQTIEELKKTQKELKILQGIIPICASCNKIRDDHGDWQKLETYIRQHSEAIFSHGVCPDCMNDLYPDYVKKGVRKNLEMPCGSNPL